MIDLATSSIGALEKVIPKLKGLVQLTGLLVAIIAFLFLRILDPSNIPAQLTGGFIGIFMLICGLAFNVISRIPQKHRLFYILSIIGMFVLGVIILFAMVIYLITSSDSYAIREIKSAVSGELSRRKEELVQAIAQGESALNTAQSIESRQQFAKEIGEKRKLLSELQAAQADDEAIERTVRNLVEQTATSARDADTAAAAYTSALSQLANPDGVTPPDAVFDRMITKGKRLAANGFFARAQLLELRGDYRAADENYRQAVATNNDAKIVIKYADFLTSLQRGSDAIAVLSPTVREIEKTPGSAGVELVSAYGILGDAYQILEDTDSAEAAYQSGIRVADNLPGDESILTGILEGQLATLYSYTGKNAEASVLFAKAISVYEKTRTSYEFQGYGTSYAGMLHQAAVNEFILGNYVEAKKKQIQANGIYEDLGVKNSINWAISLSTLAIAAYRVGDLKTAISSAEKSQKVFLSLNEKFNSENIDNSLVIADCALATSNWSARDLAINELQSMPQTERTKDFNKYWRIQTAILVDAIRANDYKSTTALVESIDAAVRARLNKQPLNFSKSIAVRAMGLYALRRLPEAEADWKGAWDRIESVKEGHSDEVFMVWLASQLLSCSAIKNWQADHWKQAQRIRSTWNYDHFIPKNICT
ncbi:tetratricopeptide repeat protein [Rhizobium leguminosarum]|uniref:tetratricopeptide repeat protein n=1 Tax=Rhizobium leguminosarum TaxID=384 RepID=UPI001C9782F5|nr:tetratricopeptide repeat protein [Rhizobium leguminosarum]MBY5816065.1 tetratricopeptide repeat protein [Rhizobium leguminosarum]